MLKLIFKISVPAQDGHSRVERSRLGKNLVRRKTSFVSRVREIFTRLRLREGQFDTICPAIAALVDKTLSAHELQQGWANLGSPYMPTTDDYNLALTAFARSAVVFCNHTQLSFQNFVLSKIGDELSAANMDQRLQAFITDADQLLIDDHTAAYVCSQQTARSIVPNLFWHAWVNRNWRVLPIAAAQ